MWLKVRSCTDVQQWQTNAARRGVAIGRGDEYSFCGKGDNFMRLGFAKHNPDELSEALRRLRLARPV